MEWTVERIKELCIKYCDKCGVTFNSPVVINGRLTRTLGRCCYIKYGNVVNPTKIEISRQLLDTATDESIEAVIAHECAHYVSAALTHEKHGHDEVFKSYCAKIGTSNDTAIFYDLQRKENTKPAFKYSFYCAKCGKDLGGRSRACKITRNPEDYFSKCCNADIKVVQNW